MIVLSHFDRPKGKVVPSMSLKPVSFALAFALGRHVAFADDCVGPVAEEAVAKLKDGDVLLLENTRFHKGEEEERSGLRQTDRQASATFSSTMRSRQPTARTPRPKASRICCPRLRAARWRPSFRICIRRSTIPSGP